MAIARPANVFAWRLNLSLEKRPSPWYPTATASTIVRIVTPLNAAATHTTVIQSCALAGTINIGINTSHGPSTKRMNRDQ